MPFLPQDDFQRQKDALVASTAKASSTAAERFTTRTEGLDEALKKSTIGLVTLSEFRKTKNDIEEAQRREAAQKLTDKGDVERERREREKEKKRKGKKNQKERGRLSFADGDGDEEDEEDNARGKKSNGKKREKEDGEEEDGAGEEGELGSFSWQEPLSDGWPCLAPAPAKRGKFTKNPTVDTSFLPDRDREARERLEREQLRKEWLVKQEKLKNEVVEITYSYWDGSGHRKSVEVRRQECLVKKGA